MLLAMGQELCVPKRGVPTVPMTLLTAGQRCFLAFLGANGGLAHTHHCRGFVSLVSPTLSLVGAQGTRTGSQSCHGGG